MRVTTRAVYDMNTWELLEWEGYDYDGPVALCGGGSKASPEQQAAAQREAALAQQEARIADQRNAREQEQYNAIKPFAFDRLQNGLPFFPALMDYTSGTTAQAFAPARADLLRRTSSMGDLPSGFKTAALSDLEQSQARAFDSNIVNNLLNNEQAKSEAARLITNQQQIANPLGFYGAASGANQAILGSQALQKTGGGIGSVLGGVLGGVAKAIPF